MIKTKKTGFLNGFRVDFYVYTSMTSKSISKLAQLWSPIPHRPGLQVHSQSHAIMPMKCMAEVPRSRPPYWSPYSLHSSKVKHWSFDCMRREFMRKSCCGWRNIGRGWKDNNGHPAVRTCKLCVDPWRFSQSAWGTTYIVSISEIPTWVCRTKI